jgi:glycosyltransferase involved in cell wall biosynthesis
MTDSQPLHTLTIVAPFYNEEQGAQDFYTALLEALDPLGIALQFVFVDDGSSDGTLVQVFQSGYSIVHGSGRFHSYECHA